MCRIAGLVTNMQASEARAKVSAMVAAMAQEPSDTCGLYEVPALGGYFGWVDREGAGHQRSVRVYGNTTLIFVGEHFGDPSGSPSQPGCGVDGAALIASYNEQGIRCFRELNGWFAGVIVDADRGEIVIFNDRLGMHRIYHAAAADGFGFASEAKALLAICPGSRALDLAGLGQYLAVGAVFDERTLFRGIGRMPGGSAWSVRAGKPIRRREYFAVSEHEGQLPLAEREFYDELSATLERVVPKYFAGTRAAVSLTGGFDSRAILAFGGAASEQRLAYTYNGLYRECADARVARRVAAAAGYRHDVVAIDGEFLARFPEQAERTIRVTDGTLDLTAAHEVYLSRKARQLATIRITGNYGGEVFRRVSTFKPVGLPRNLFAPEIVPYLDEALEGFSALTKRHPVSFAVYDEIPSSLFGRLAAAQSQLTVRTPYTDNALVALAYRIPQPPTDETSEWSRIIRARAPRLAAIPTDRGRMGGRRWTARVERLYGYALFKGEWYYDAGMPAWLSRLDRAARRPAPPFFVGSHKIQHYRRWFRDELGDYLESLIGDSARARTYLNGVVCRRLVGEHRSGSRNRVTEISVVGAIELVHRGLFETKYPEPSALRVAEEVVS